MTWTQKENIVTKYKWLSEGDEKVTVIVVLLWKGGEAGNTDKVTGRKDDSNLTIDWQRN